MKPLRTVCVARQDVLQGGLSDNHFAAQLDKIVRAPQEYPVYGDADQFFAITYPTTGLRTLLTKTFGRIAGAKGTAGENGVLRPETSFGGGKTHGLAAVYHLALGARPTSIEEFLDPALLPSGPVQVAAVVGDALDPIAGLETKGIRTYTIWGEMAAQLGPTAYAALEENDRLRGAPGTQTIKEAFGGQPTIIMIDEIAQHLRQAVKSGSEDARRYASAIPVFLKNLFEVAGDPSNRVVVIVTLASAVNAFGKETNEIAELLDESNDAVRETLSEAQDALTRMVQANAVIKPAEDAEIGEILKRRLFESIDSSVAAETAAAYQALYEGLLNEGEVLSGGPEQPVTYGALIERSYPFHPELVRVLDKRLGAIPRFQRARGALKLLAEVVAGIYHDGDDTDIINVADIDYSDEPILNHLTSGLDRPEFAGVASVDIAGPTSHASAVDLRVFPGHPPYATRVGRTVFTHSLEMTQNAGAGRTEWLIGTLRPGDTATLLEKALQESERTFWHLATDGARFRFQIEPNVNRILDEEKANVQNSRVAQIMDDLIFKAFCNDGGALAIHYPTGPVDVSDATQLRIVVINPDQVSVTQKQAEVPPSLLVEILDRVGQTKGIRTYRNSVVFVVADSDQSEALKDRVRALIAADAIAGDAGRMTQFTDDVRKKIEAYQKNARLEVRVAITRCFKHVYYPVNDKAHSHLRHRDLPAQQQGDTKSATAVVLNLLTDENKIKNDKPSYDWIRSKAWPAAQGSVTTEALRDWFWMDHGASIIRDPSPIREAIMDGIRNDGWVYYDAATGKTFKADAMAGLAVDFRADTEVMTQAEASARGLLIRRPSVNDLKGIVTGSKVVTGAQVRSALEAKCGGEPTKGDVLEVLSTAVSQTKYEWLVVLDSEPAANVTALTPSDIVKKGLDTLRVLTRDAADAAGVVIKGRIVEKNRFTAKGPSGVALAQLITKVEDMPGSRATLLTIEATADDQRGTGDVDLLASSLGMLQQHDITVYADFTAEFSGIDGALEFSGSGARKDFQTLNTTLSKILSAASAVSGTLKIDLRFETPLEVDGQVFAQIQGILKNLNITSTTISAEVTK